MSKVDRTAIFENLVSHPHVVDEVEKMRQRDSKKTAGYRKRSWAEVKLSSIRNRAKAKGWAFDLTIDDVKSLDECFYCGDKATGFDRVDSGKGYTKDNVVHCCAWCNRMKLAESQADFIAKCKQIADRFS